MQTQAYNAVYINNQLTKYRAAQSTEGRIECFWRIASHADLFPVNDLDCTGQLSDQQVNYIYEWLATQGFTV